ncbi:MAG: hypothetical protein KDA61_04275, partial [Planctomycetales bacterium]|nr:hypothetical protein [Planctomycetales bacterium]
GDERGIPRRFAWKALCACIAWGALLATESTAQHGDFTIQRIGQGVVVGTVASDGMAIDFPRRVFATLLPASFAVNDPGIAALPADSPLLLGELDALPSSSWLLGRFVKVRSSGISGSLLFWDVENSNSQEPTFKEASAGVTLSLFGVQGDRLVAGAEIDDSGQVNLDTTSSEGVIHRHLYFFLEQSGGAASPPEGVYLAALRFGVEGLGESLPTYLLVGTPTVARETLTEIAEPWLSANLSRFESAQRADFDLDDDVDGADLLLWQRKFGTLEVPGSLLDIDDDGVIGSPEFLAWNRDFGNVAAGAALVVPELQAEGLCGAGFVAVVVGRRSRRRANQSKTR